MKELATKMEELTSALSSVTKSQIELKQAVANARVKAEELSALMDKIINQPHIQINEYEIDN